MIGALYMLDGSVTNKHLVYVFSDMQCHIHKIKAPSKTCITGKGEYKTYKLLYNV